MEEELRKRKDRKKWKKYEGGGEKEGERGE